MSSILEALKELEGDQARASKKATTVVDAPRPPERSLGALIPLSGGLAIGILAFGLYEWGPRFSGAPATPPAAPAAGTVAETKAPPRGPEWLERAEAPRARVAPLPDAPPPPSPRPAPTASEAPAAGDTANAPASPTPTAPAAERAAAAPRAAATPKAAASRSAGDRRVELEGLAFSAHTYSRTVTLFVDGRRATLHQGESLGGVEVQLIMADGVYLQRGPEVFFVSWPR